MNTTTPRIGVVGTGWWATQHHIPALRRHKRAELVALADRDPEKLKLAAEQFDVDRTFLDPDELFASGLVDGVVIAVPHAFHHPLTKAALEAGLHVLVEKPMTLTAREAWELVAIAEQRDLHLMVGYTYQFTDTAQACRRIIQSGRIGELLHISGLFASMVESYYRGQPEDYSGPIDFPVTAPSADTYSDPHISGGGQGQTQVTHAMGMVLWVTDQSIREVSAFMANRDLAVDLVDAISYRTEAGAVGTMGSTGSLRPDQPRQQELRYYGTEGFVLQDLRQGTIEAHFNDGTNERHGPLDEHEVYPADAPAPALSDLIGGRAPNPAPAVPAARTVEFLEAAYRSAKSARPIRVEELRTDSKEPST